jgi:hypothetical protein
VSSPKSHWAEILVTRRVEQVERYPHMLEAHHRRGHRDAALAIDRHQSGRARRRSPRAFTSPANRIAPPNSSSFSLKMVLRGRGAK